MPIPWPGLFNALSIVDAAARLWSSMRSGPSGDAQPGMGEKLTSHAQGLTALEARAQAIEAGMSRIEEQLVSTSQVVQSLADQHYQVVQAVEVLRRRCRVLGWSLAALALVTTASLLSLALR